MDNQSIVCECDKCNSKQEEEEKNDEGVAVHKSWDPYHKKAYRYYCGRNVNGDYPNPCGSCDGRCGPNNGCQCKSCFRYQFEQKGEEPGVAYNFEGAKVKRSMDNMHQNKELFYCGRKIGAKCFENGCDVCIGKGVCGLEGGCQCKACFKLNEDYSKEGCSIM